MADGAIARFGSVDVVFDHIEKPPAAAEDEQVEADAEPTISIGEFEFRRKLSDEELQDTQPVDEEAGESPEGTAETVTTQETGSGEPEAPAGGAEVPVEEAGPDAVGKENDTQ